MNPTHLQKQVIMWATAQDVKNKWISDSSLPSDEKITSFIEDVEEQIVHRFPGLQQRIDAGKISLKYVKNRIVNIVIEFLITKGNPHSQESQSFSGIASKSVSYSSSAARYTLTLTESDLAAFSGKFVGQAYQFSLAPHMGVKHEKIWHKYERDCE